MCVLFMGVGRVLGCGMGGIIAESIDLLDVPKRSNSFFFVHCRCGRLYCEEHCKFQMKLSPSAHPEPESGVWARTCILCFTTRDGFSDTTGVSRSRTNTFLKARKQLIDKVLLETNKLEKRLLKLAELHAETVAQRRLSHRLSYLFDASKKEEMGVVKWESDADIVMCPICR